MADIPQQTGSGIEFPNVTMTVGNLKRLMDDWNTPTSALKAKFEDAAGGNLKMSVTAARLEDGTPIPIVDGKIMVSMCPINATPHALNIFATQDAASKLIVSFVPIPGSAGGIRLKSRAQETLSAVSVPGFGDIPVVSAQAFVSVEVPAALQAFWDDEQVPFIVSLPVAQFVAAKRKNIFTIGSGPSHVVRSATGQIVGTTALERHS